RARTRSADDGRLLEFHGRGREVLPVSGTPRSAGQPQHSQERSRQAMASAPPPRAFSLHGHTCLLDEHDRMFFQHSHSTDVDAERTSHEEGPQGVPASLYEKIQRKSEALHLDQRAGSTATNHRSDERIPGDPPQAAETAKGPPE